MCYFMPMDHSSDVERFTRWLRDNHEPPWPRLRAVMSTIELAPQRIVVADFSTEGSSVHEGRVGECVHLVVVTPDRRALLLNVFLDGEGTGGAMRSVRISCCALNTHRRAAG
jgi:hypothetical protein